jgi:hypothetical protein
MAGVVVVILTVLLAGPMVLGTFAAAERLTDRAQMTWFRLLTALFALALLAGLVALILTPV